MPERQCSTCKRQAEWGCTAKRIRWPAEGEEDGPENWSNPASLPVDVDGEEIWACPRQDLKENGRWFGRLFLLYGLYRRGFLPNAGAAVDQVNSTVELFTIIDQVNEDCDETLEEQRRANLARNGKGSLV